MTEGWATVYEALDAQGYARLPGLVSAEACGELAELYEESARFRSRVVMGRHGFGRGEYQYFAEPLPPVVAALRRDAYPELVGIANTWAERSGLERRFPKDHAGLRAECAAAGQTRPTPLLLKYGPGDYNCLHQDLYGDVVFPLQLAVLLSQPGEDFEGGELVLTTQRPRMQSRVDVVPLRRGDAVVFATHHRPVQGTRGSYRVNVRHGVSPVRRGQRYTLGVIFHDAR